MRVLILIEYDGTNYAGWQRQNNAKTIQEEIEEALFLLTKEKTVIYGAGRTDAGVHAYCQTAHFETNSNIPPDKFCDALNFHLPKDIRIKKSAVADENFHARYSACSKHYRYVIHNQRTPSAIGRDYAMHVPMCLDIKKMQEAAKKIVGKHDFTSFCTANSAIEDKTREITCLKVEKNADEIYVDVIGNGFLHNMVRIIVGTLIEIGLGKKKDIEEIFAARDRKMAGPTAKACGLFMMKVLYEKELF